MHDRSFPKNERLLKPAEFVNVRKLGRRSFTKSLTLHALPNGLSRKRLGLSLSARVGNAVRRNRVKRLIREIFRLNKDFFPDSSDILVSVKNIEGINNYSDMEKELKGALDLFRKKG